MNRKHAGSFARMVKAPAAAPPPAPKKTNPKKDKAACGRRFNHLSEIVHLAATNAAEVQRQAEQAPAINPTAGANAILNAGAKRRGDLVIPERISPEAAAILAAGKKRRGEI